MQDGQPVVSLHLHFQVPVPELHGNSVMILLGLAIGAVTWIYFDPSAPLHGFLFPAHYTPGILLGQVIGGLVVSGICLWLTKKLHIF